MTITLTDAYQGQAVRSRHGRTVHALGDPAIGLAMCGIGRRGLVTLDQPFPHDPYDGPGRCPKCNRAMVEWRGGPLGPEAVQQ